MNCKNHTNDVDYLIKLTYEAFEQITPQQVENYMRHAIELEKKTLLQFEFVNDSNDSNPEYGYDTDTYSYTLSEDESVDSDDLL